MIAGIENRFFEGAGNQGKNPKYSLSDLENDNFRWVMFLPINLRVCDYSYFVY